MWTMLLALCWAQTDEEEEPIEYDFAAEAIGGALAAPSAAPAKMRAAYGATPGGAQDIAYFRDQVARGDVPLPQVFTSEGLLSEHDLPLSSSGQCSELLCTNTKAVQARLVHQPEVTHLVQLGFDSGFTPERFRRAPMHLVAVVDQSCSMSGAPIDTVRASLEELVRHHLDGDDTLSVVLYGTGVTTWLPPTPVTDPEALAARIAAIPIDGSTNMEAGMQAGFDLARSHPFDGTRRLMLFTDERPNTGNTEASGFMGLARAASADGIGMTTLGVGAHFGAELAADISAVRGGNLFFFPDAPSMRERFRDDFDTMVTELAYDLEVSVRPADGLRIAGIHGVPGDLVQWSGDQLQLTVETLFLSKDRGGIYLALAPVEGGAPVDDTVARVDLSYTPRGGGQVARSRPVHSVQPSSGDEGLVRGPLLIDTATTLVHATTRYHQHNDPEGAWQAVRALRGRLQTADATLAAERRLVDQLHDTLAQAAGRAGEPVARHRDPLTGLPR
jgi:Ca-activated chloride channel family protein